MPDQELDEFGIPIKNKAVPTNNIATDEFGIPLKKKDTAPSVGTTSKDISQLSAVGGVSTPQSPSQLPSVNPDSFLGDAIKAGQRMGAEPYKPIVAPNQRAVSESTSNPSANRQRDLVEKVIPMAAAKKAEVDKAIDETAVQRAVSKKLPQTKDIIDSEKDFVRRMVQDGDLVYDNGKLKRGTGFLGSLYNSIEDSHKQNLDNNFMASLPKDKAIEYLNARIENPSAFHPEEGTATNGILGAFGKMIGENTSGLVKGVGGGIIAGALAPETGGASFGTFLATVKDFTNAGYAQIKEKNYATLKKEFPNMSDSEAYDKADASALVGGIISLTTNALLSHSIVPKTPIPTAPVKGVMDAFERAASHAIGSSPKVLGSAAAGSLINDATAKAIGVDVKGEDVLKNAGEATKSMAIMHFGMAGAAPFAESALAAKDGVMKYGLAVLGADGEMIKQIPSYLRPQLENVVASAPRQEVADFYTKAEQAGVMPQGTTQKVLGKLAAFDKAKATLAPFVISEEKRAAITGKLLEKEKLTTKLAEVDAKAMPTAAAELQTQIDGINEQVDAMYKAKDVFSKEVDKGTGETAKPIVQESSVPTNKTIEPATKDEPKQEGGGVGDKYEQTAKERNREQKMKEEGLQLELAPLTIVNTPETIKRKQEIEDNNQKVIDRIKEIDSDFDAKQQPNDTTATKNTTTKQPEDNSTAVQGSGAKAKPISAAGEPTEPTAELGQEGKPKEVKPFITKSGKQHVIIENGVTKVVDAITGKEVSKPTQKKALREYADTIDFTKGKLSTEIPEGVQTESETKQHIIATTENPFELAEIYANEEPTTRPLSTTERMIADYGIGNVTNDSFNRHGDRNLIGISLAKQYLRKTGESIDVVAKEMSDHYDYKIEPQDIVDFMVKFPNGEGQALKEVESGIAVDAAVKFNELTGLDLNNEMADKVINQHFDKLSKQEQEIAYQDYETRQQLEADYWKAHEATDGFTKETNIDKPQQASGYAAESTQAAESIDIDAPIEKSVAKNIADNIRKFADNIENFSFGEGGAMSDITAIPRFIIGKSLKAAAKIIELGGTVAEAIAEFTKEIRTHYNENKIDFKEKELKEQSVALFKNNGLISSEPIKITKAQINSTVETGGVKGDKVVTTARAALKKQIRDFAKGAAQGFRDGRDEGMLAGQMSQGRKMAKEITTLQDSYNKKSTSLKAKYEQDLADKKNASTQKITSLKAKYKEDLSDLKTKFAEDKKNIADSFKHKQQVVGDVVSDYLKQAVIEGNLTPSQAKSIAIRAAKIGTSEAKLNSFIKYADKVIDDVNYAQKLSDAQSFQKSIKKALKSDGTFANAVDVLNAAKRMNLDELSSSDLEAFNEIATDFKNSKRGVNDPLYKPFDITKAEETLADLQKQLDKSTIRSAEELSGVHGLTLEEAKAMKEALDAENFDEYADNLDEAKKKTVHDALRKAATYSQVSLTDLLADPDFAETVNSRAPKMIQDIADADLSNLTPQQLSTIIKTVDNLVINGSTANIPAVHAIIEASKVIPELQPTMAKVKFFDLNKVQRALESYPLLMKAIFGNSEVAGKFRSKTGLEKVVTGGSQTEKQVHTLYSKWVNYKKANKIEDTNQARYKRGIYAFLTQHEGGTPEDINAQYLNKKGLVKQSIEAYKGKESTMDMAVELEKVFDAYVNKHDRLVDFMKDFRSHSNKDVQMVRFFQNEFAGTKEDLRFITEGYMNEKFDGNNYNYSPISYSSLTPSVEVSDNSVGMYSQSKYANKAKQNPNSIKRVEMEKLPNNMALNFDFDGNMFNKYQKIKYDINTIEGRALFAEVAKTKGFDGLVGGGDNADVLIDKYNQFEQMQGNGGRADFDEAGQIIKRTLQPIKNIATSLSLGGFTQYPKQYISVAAKTITTLAFNGNGHLFFEAMKADLGNIPLLNEASVEARGLRKGGTDIANHTLMADKLKIVNGIKKAASKVSQLTDWGKELSLKSLTVGDTRVAKRSFLAYYMDYLQRNGVDVKLADLPTEHERLDGTRKDAISYAQQMLDETQVVSNEALASDYQRPGNGYKELFKTVFSPFNTFALNHRLRVAEDYKFIRKGSKEQRAEAFKDITGNLVEIASYAAIKGTISYGLIYGGNAAINAIFGTQKDDKDLFKKTYQSAISFAIREATIGGLGNITEDEAVNLVNSAAYKLHKLQNPSDPLLEKYWIKENSPIRTFPNSDKWYDNIGAYGVPIRTAQKDFNDIKAAATGLYDTEYNFKLPTKKVKNDPYGKITLSGDKESKVKLSESQQDFMKFATFIDALQVFGISDADFNKTIEAKKRLEFKKEK